MKTKCMYLFITALVILSFLFFNCGGAENKAGGLGSLDEPVTITVWGWPAADLAFESIIEGFNEIYPNITVEWEMKPGQADGVRDSLTAAIAAGAGAPDVSMIEIKDIDKFVLYGGLQNLLAEPFNAGEYSDDFVEYKWNQGSSMDGEKLYAFPWDIGPASIFYRRDVFEAAGLPSDPESVEELLGTWEKFVETGKIIKANVEGVWFTDTAQNIPYIYYSHKNFFDEDLNISIDNEKTRQVLKIAQIVRNEGLDASLDLWTEEWYQALGNGQVAVSISGCWFGGFLKGWIAADTSGSWGIVPVPEDPLQNWGGSFLAIPEQSENKLAAWAFIEYVCATKEAQNKIFKAVDYFPAYKPAYDDPLYSEPDEFFGGQKTREVWANIAQSQGKFITTALDAAAEAVFTTEVRGIINEGLDINTGITNIISAIESQISDDREALKSLMNSN